jgi:Ni/Fe-hydrogenase subunit HybB-like protein
VRAAMAMIFAGALYRFDTYLVAFVPGENWSYFPSVPELTISVGLVAFEILAYIVIVKTFPILATHNAVERQAA